MTASPTPPDAQVGLPSDGRDQMQAKATECANEFFAESAKKSVGLPSEDFRMISGASRSRAGYSLATDAFRQARAILDLIRPAFEAKEREIERLRDIRDRRGAKIIDLSERALSAEAKLAQAVEALRQIKALKSQPIGDTGYASGPLALLNAAQRIARDELRRARSAAAMGEKSHG